MAQTELALIAARDRDAMARFYDHHVAVVGEFCAAVCPDEQVDEAVAAVFMNFLARATEAPTDAEPAELLLRRAAREVAASRMEIGPASPDEPGEPVCRAMPALLAARINGELPGRERPVVDHLIGCRTCQETAARLGQAEVMFPVGSGGEVIELRRTWLQLAGETPKATQASGTSEPPEQPLDGVALSPPPTSVALSPPPTSVAPSPPPSHKQAAGPSQPPQRQQVSVRARRGGLVGAVRRFGRIQSADYARRDSGDAARDT